jgi:hypothetical protein
VSVESRSPIRSLRRASKEPEHPDYSEPDFSSWAARLADYTPPAPVASASEPAMATVTAPATVTEVAAAPTAVALDTRPSLEEVLEKLLSFDGALCVAIVDSETGMILGARLASTKALGTDEKIDDVLISLTSQVQIIHPLPSNPSIFTYLIGDKAKASLAMARYKATEADLQIQL